MGIKKLLGRIKITDTSSSLYTTSHPSGSTNFRKSERITCVYDEDERIIECYDAPFTWIEEDSSGFGGDYFGEQSYEQYSLKKYGSTDIWGSFSPGKSHKIGNKVYVLHTNDNIVYVFSENGDPLSDEDFGSGELSDSKSMCYDTTLQEMYILCDGTTVTEIKVFDYTTGEYKRSFGSGTLTNPRDLDIIPDTNRLYVHDTGATSVVVVFDYTDGTHKSSEDFGSHLSIPSQPRITVSNTLNRAYINTGNLGYGPLVSYNLSTGAEIPSEQITISGENILEARVDDTTNKMYCITPAGGIYTFDISTPTSPVEITEERISPDFANNYRLTLTQDGYLLLPSTDYDLRTFSVNVFPAHLLKPRKRDRVDENTGSYWKRSDKSYTTIEGDNYIQFIPFSSPPYFLKRSIPIIEIVDQDLSYDLEATFTDYTNPTGKRTPDGSVTIEATGGTSPYTYQIIGANNSNENPQSSGKFSTLYPGTYRFRVTDANKVSIDLPPFELSVITNTFSNYSAIHHFEWTGYEGSQHRVEIVQRGYQGSSTALSEMGPEPFQWSARGEGSDLYNHRLISVQAKITLNSDQMYTYLPLAQADEVEYGIIKYTESSPAVFTEEWRGLLSPRSYSEQMSGGNHFTTFIATDRTGDLQNLYFTGKPSDAEINTLRLSPGFDLSSFFKGKHTLFQIIHYCMRQLNMDMGYRIAIDLFEDNHTKTTGNDPLRQTSVDTRSYFENKTSWNLQKVMIAMLASFKARLVGWGGYWYIEDAELKLTQSTINYLEFDARGNYVGTGSYAQLIDFKSTNQNTKFRFVDKPTITTTEIYKGVELELPTRQISRLTPAFEFGNLRRYGSEFTSIEGFPLVRGNTCNVYYTDKENRQLSPSSDKEDKDKIHEVIDMEGSIENSNTYHICTTTIESGTGDAVKLTIDAEVSSPYTKSPGSRVVRGGIIVNGAAPNSSPITPEVLDEYTPYVPMKWQLKLGSHWYDFANEEWVQSSITNLLYVKNKDLSIELIIDLPEEAQSEETLQLKLYAATIWEHDLSASSRANMITALQAVETKDATTTRSSNRDIQVNTRIITRHEKTEDGITWYHYYYYELQDNIGSASTPDIIEPDDYNSSTNNKRWKLIKGPIRLDYTSGNRGTTTNPTTINTLKDLAIQFLPGGEEPPEEFTLSKNGEVDNHLVLPKTLEHFDIPPNINNAARIYYNHYFLTGTTTPTSQWYKTGGLKRRIQEHLLDWLVRLTKATRFRVNGSIWLDVLPTPLNVYRDPTDDNRRYLMMSGTSGTKKNIITGGEFLEIGSDTAPESSAFSSATDSSNSN